MMEVQLLTIPLLAIFVLGTSFIWLRKEHMGGRVIATRVGALIYGLIFGAFVGMVMVPLRMQMLDGGVEAMDDNTLLMRYLPTFAFFILIVRSDVTGRLPFVGTYIRAYRAAMLRKTIAGAERRLGKMAKQEGQGSEV